MVAGQARTVVRQIANAVQICVSGRSLRSRAAGRQVLAGRDAVTVTTDQLLAAVARGH